MDIPSARSSHRVPPPWGGVAIVAGFLGCLALTAVLGAVEIQSLAALLPAGAWVAVIGCWMIICIFPSAGDCWGISSEPDG